MDRLDRLLLKARPKPTLLDELEENNPYMGKSSDELLDYMDGNNYRAPDMKTPEWGKFMHALVHAVCVGGLIE